MSWLTRLRNLGRSDKVTDDIDREMQFHLAERTDQLEAAGLTPDAARQEAQRRFGNYTLERERTHDRDVLLWLETFFGDVRYALRALRAAPGFAFVVVGSLALGIGANTAIFTLINIAMLKPLPVSRPDELVRLTPAGGPAAGGKAGAVNRALFDQIRDRRDPFAGVLQYGSSNVDLSRGGEARRVNVGLVSGEFFSVLGVRPAAGRTFAATDDTPGCPAIAVITHPFWQREFGGSADVVGRSVPLNGQPYEVVGVTGPDFFGIEYGWDMPIWIPLCAERLAAGGSRAGAGLAVARLNPGVSAEQSQTKLAAILPALLEATVPPNAPPEAAARYRSMTLRVEPFANGIPFLRDRYGDALTTLMAIVGVVLVVACANIANLLLARSTTRRREIAVRLALGATRFRLVRQWLTESLLLAFAGAAAGVLLAFWASRGLVGLLSNSIAVDVSPDANVFMFTLAVGMVTGTVFGLAPAVALRTPARRRRDQPLETLLGAGRGVAHGDSRFRPGKALVVGQIALSLVMLTAAGLLLSSWGQLLQIDPGFRSENVLLAGINTSPARIPPDQRGDTYRRILERLRAIPGVSLASGAWITPLGQNADVVVDATGFAPGSPTPVQARLNQVTDSYFRTVGTPLLAGRDFGPQDVLSPPWVAIVNEELARRVYGAVNVVGQHFRVQENRGLSNPVEIVGVVADTKWGTLREASQPIVYYALSQMTQPGPGTNFALLTDGPAASVAAGVKAVMTEIDPRISLTLVPLAQRVEDSIKQPRTLAVLAGCFGGLVLVLAMIGLYGTLSYSVGRRRNELAVRLALGATHTRIMSLVLGEMGRLVAIGLAIGLALSVVATRLVSSFLYGVTPRDPVTFALAGVTLAVVALAAALIPARRAARMDPVAALREE